MTPIELHEATKRALALHFESCQYRCTTNHIKCRLGWRLVAIEESAWFAGRLETLGTNRPTTDDPQPVPHEPCCPAAPLGSGGAS